MPGIFDSFPLLATQTGGDSQWNDPGLVTVSDDVRAQVDIASFFTAATIEARQFSGFLGIGAAKTLLKVTVFLEGFGPGLGRTDYLGIQLVDAGTPVGDIRTIIMNAGSESDQQVDGTTDDLWGTLLTVAKIKANDFGMNFTVARLVGGQGVARVDSVRIRVETDGAAEQNISLYYLGKPFATGSATGITRFQSGSKGTFTFEIRNDGNANLTLGITPAALTVGTVYTITSQPPGSTVIVPGGSEDVVVNVNDTVTPGLRDADTITFNSDDPDTPAYTLIFRAEIIAVAANTCDRWPWRSRTSNRLWPPRRICVP